MKNLDEKKLLVKMARAFGQEVDQELLESIEREERLTKLLFEKKEEAIVEPAPILEPIIEQVPTPLPAPPPVADVVQRVADVISSPKFAKPTPPDPRDVEIEGLKKSLVEIMQKVSTLSWGGGGTGVVRIWDTDDFNRSSAYNGRYMRWDNGVFSLAEVNPHDIVYETTLVTSNVYTVTDQDYYIGVNYAGPSTIILPLFPSSGRTIIVKDESGNAETNNITLSGTIDNDSGGAVIAINNGALQLIYRDCWRII
jgi:hypothetical protein